MTNAERSQQIWSVLVFAAREQKVVSYPMIEKMTGMDKRGLGEPLGNIYYYCKRHKLPLLNTLLISQEAGKPIPDMLQGLDLPTEYARVFVFDWLSRGVPSTQDFETARAAEEAKATTAGV